MTLQQLRQIDCIKEEDSAESETSSEIKGMKYEESSSEANSS